MINSTKRVLIVSLSILTISISACGSSSDDGDKDKVLTNTTQVTSYTPNDGRLLAAGCAQCHGTNGISVNKWDSIAGEDNLHKEMFEKKGIMLSQAKGYTDAEITLMENYLNSISKNKKDDEGDKDDD